MIRMAIFIIVLFATSYLPVFAVNSQWYWQSVPDDPQKGYFYEVVDDIENRIGYTEIDEEKDSDEANKIVNRLVEALQLTESSVNCSGEMEKALQSIRDFDESANHYTEETRQCSGSCKDLYFDEGRVIGVFQGTTIYVVDVINEETIQDREKLFERLEKRALSCLDEEVLQEQKEEEERVAEQRVKDVQEAVEECDFEFFDEEMTSRERMQTYNERIACKETGEPVEEVDNDTKTVEREDLLKQIQVLLELIVQLQAQMTATQG